MAIFSDDFNRANSTDLGTGWVEVSGDWSIVSNQLSPGAAGGTIILRAAGAMAGNDNYAQVTIAATTAASQGVWCRGNSNITQGYLWRNNGTSWDLFQVFGGSFTNIGTYAAAAAPGDVAKVQAVGSTIKGFVNGVQRVSVTDTAVTTGTSVGIRSDSAGAVRYDDFAAGDVSAGATLATAAATETAQSLASSKTTTLGTAAATGAAQPVTSTKTGALPVVATAEAAQALTGTKTTPLGSTAATEAAQPLTGSKTVTLGTALETAASQTLAGTKTAPLPVAAQTEIAQPLVVAKSRSLSTASSVEAAQPLAGAKSAALGPALETSTARPLAAAGGPDLDIDVTVGSAYSPWAAGQPYTPAWSAQAQASDWEVGAPC
ncbi:hypothetical protein ACFWD7_06400 [Streptomyces mirabilis]|uniref:hypothetical protein n=1 Tax=Streptomyces mirabilis TaxID=68239 RepID=UPI0036A64C97